MQGKFLFLGTGGSMGIPVITCQCKVCLSHSAFNKRLRPSGLIEIDGKKILVDVGPDFRQQALRIGLDRIDGMLLTHIHNDHIAGVDDLRIFYFKQKHALSCMLSVESLEDLKVRYHYLFRPIGEATLIPNRLEFHLMDDDFGEIEYLGLNWQYMSYFQLGVKVSGFRLGNIAYLTDLKEYSDEVFVMLKGVKKLIISALRQSSSFAHLSISEAIAFAQKVGAEETWFTHIAHEIEHEETNKKLPSGIRLAYDNLEIVFQYE